MKPELICYDFDGTLCNTMPDIAESINVALDTMGYKRIPVSQVRNFVGNGISKLIARSLSFSIAQQTGQELSEKELERFSVLMQTYYFDHMTDASNLYDGVKEVLEYFKDVPQIVVSNKPVKMLHSMLKYYGVDQYFSLVVGGDSLDVCKPDLKVWELVKSQMNIQEPIQAVMVGDSKPDVEFGLNAGMKTIAVTYGYNDVPVLKESGAEIICDHFKDLIKLI